MVPSCGPRGCGTLRALATLAGIQEQLKDCVTARDPGKLDRGKAWRAGTHPGVHRPTAPRPATFRTRLPRRYPRLFPLARSPFLHASRVPPSLAFGFHGSPRPRERLRRRVPDARARQPPGESCAHAQWPASREGGGSRGLTRKCLCLRERRSGPRLARALRRWRWAVSMQRLLLPSLRALTGSRNVGLLVPGVASRTQVPTPAGSGHGSRAGIKKARIK